MQSRHLVLIATLLAGTSALAAPDLPTYAVTELKALGIRPVAMNGRGHVVGSAASDVLSTSQTRTYLLSAGSVTELFPPTDAPNVTTPVLLNDAGQVVFVTGTHAGWVYDGASYRRIEPPAAADPRESVSYFRVAYSNTAGQIVGEVSYQFNWTGRRVWLDDGGVMQILNPLGARSCGVWGLNKWGDVALECDFGSSTEPYKGVLGVRYRDGAWREIDVAEYVVIVGINDSRAVLVRGYGDVPSYLLDDAGTHVIDPICDVGSFLCRAGVVRLNDRSEVVGSSYFSISTEQLPQVRTIQRALLWRKGLSRDISPPGDGNSVATAINNHGVAVGTYVNEAGKERPFVHAAGASMDLAELRGVGAALDLTLAESNLVFVDIVDSGHILVNCLRRDSDRELLYYFTGAHLLSPVVPTVSLSADASQTGVGRPVTLTWNSTDANSCAASGGVPGDGWAGTWPTSGQLVLTANVPSDVRYSMRCSAGPVHADAVVSVTYRKKSSGGGRLDGVAALLLGVAGLGLSRRRSAN